MSVILSVIIPTRNGSKYLDHLLALCSKTASPKVEFLVVDNSDLPYENDTVNDARIKILRDGNIRSMADNWDYGASKALGAWKCFLGDDDGILPRDFDSFVDELAVLDADVAIAGFSHYFWPGSVDFVSKARRPFGRVTTWIDGKTQKSPRQLSGNPIKDFDSIWFPLPYARSAFHETLEQVIRSQNQGHLFSATSPDFNLGAALQINATRLEFVNLCPFIVGTSSKSNGVAFLKDPQGELALDFSRKNSHPWLAELGREQPPLSYLSYLEPVLQAIRSKTGSLPLPKPTYVILRTLFTDFERKKVLVEALVTIYPNLRKFVYIVALLRIPFLPLVKIGKFFIFGLRRVLTLRAKFKSAEAEGLDNIFQASERIGELRGG